MSCGCDRSGYGRFFNQRFARRLAKRYRKRGLDGSSQLIADFVTSRGVEGATVLEIGGGVGEIQLELLKAGAAGTTNLELSPGYEQASKELVDEAAVAGKVERLFGDIVQEPSLAPEADAVVLNRVVCCYPDAEALMTAVAARASFAIALSFPPGIWAARLVVGATNLMLRIRGSEFRAYVHPQTSILAPALARGFRVDESGRAGVWRVVALVR